MKKKKLIFVGSVNLGGIADDGETMKNRILLKYLYKEFDEIFVVDTRHRLARIYHMIKYIILLLFYRKTKIIFSASSFVTYKLIKIASCFSWNFNQITYWVIGGRFAEFIEHGEIQKNLYLKMNRILVEGDAMTDKLKLLGFDNVLTVPNFKEITYLPKLKSSDNGIIKFVFLSRIIPQKGVDLIISASKELNKMYSTDFIVDFYGKIDPAYEDNFNNKIKDSKILNYKGFLDLTTDVGYDTLSSYDIMLFPTFWNGEGFPGIVIDAYIAGLPIIASDWNLNSEIIRDNVTGIIIPPNDVHSLISAMSMFINRKTELYRMSKNAQKEVLKFDAKNIISKQFLKSINVL